ncbi:MAG: HAMP domain-containing histidine kinase [Magnetococcales bacterium]|nr:HAMP domain-containing histidine kinase [Magnetococcales bacterium]
MRLRLKWRHLRFRVAVAFASFGGVVSLLLAVSLYFTAHDLGVRLIDEILKAELEDYVARRGRNPRSLPPATATVLGFVQPEIPTDPPFPPELSDLPLGRSDLAWRDAQWRVAVHEQQGVRYSLLYNVTLHQRRESRFLLFLALGAGAMILFATAGGLWLAGRVIAPVSELAERVRTLGMDESASRENPYSGDEVGELAQVFDQRHAQLQAFLERERAFTADVSHELRTPLAIIQGAVEILLDDDDLSPRTRRRVERADRAAREMTVLTTALLLLSREESLQARTETRCSAAEVVRAVVEQSRYLLGDKPVGVALDLQADPQLPVDWVFLHIVVGNLVRNAFSYTREGEIRLTLTANRLSVADTGSGIRADELSRIFHRHYRGVTSQGAGIGLSLVKRICERCRWEVIITSREGEGTEAVLCFPPAADLPSRGKNSPSPTLFSPS